MSQHTPQYNNNMIMKNVKEKRARERDNIHLCFAEFHVKVTFLYPLNDEYTLLYLLNKISYSHPLSKLPETDL
jgi:hypothetical protein